jgi:hypothetical protein
MKLFLGHLLGFAFMTVVCLVLFGTAVLFIPLLGAFLSWSLDPLTFDFSVAMFVARLIFVLSVFFGVCFTTSKEGKAFAHQFAEE